LDADGVSGTAVPSQIAVRPVNLTELWDTEREVSDHDTLEAALAVRPVNLIEQEVSGRGTLKAALHRTSATACACTPDCAHTEARVSLAQVDAHAVDEDNFRSGPVFISGAGGSEAAAMSGYYEPAVELGMDGRVIYTKFGDGGVCIEHFAGFWQVKRNEDKGNNTCMASVAGGCALVDCSSRIWSKTSPNGPNEDVRMKLLTGDDAEQEVSSGCISRIKATDHHQCCHSRVHALTCTFFVPAVREDTRRASPSRRRSTHHFCCDEWIHVRARRPAHEWVLPAHQGEAGGTSGVREGERCKHVPGVLAGQMAHQAV
jgi:hypothetical protein